MKIDGIFIPKEILEDKRLNALDKITLMEIESLESEKVGCINTNNELAQICNCSDDEISTIISKLQELNYIKVIYLGRESRTLKSNITTDYNKALKNLKNDYIKQSKKRKEHSEMKECIEVFTTNEELKFELHRYLEFRLASGRFTLEQWRTILDEIARYYQERKEYIDREDAMNEVIEKVHHSFVCGYKKIYFDY